MRFYNKLFVSIFFVAVGFCGLSAGVIEKTHVHLPPKNFLPGDDLPSSKRYFAGDNLRVGDHLLGLDQNGKYVQVRVERIVECITEALIVLRIKGADGTNGYFYASPQQLLYDPVKRGWIEAQYISDENFLLGMKGEILPVFHKGQDLRTIIFLILCYRLAIPFFNYNRHREGGIKIFS